MSATYNTRITSKLNELATLLAKNNYPKESTAIRTIIGKIMNWKEGEEWNPNNALGLPDADHVLEDVISKFNLAITESAKREMAKKNAPASTEEGKDMEQILKDMGTALEGIT